MLSNNQKKQLGLLQINVVSVLMKHFHLQIKDGDHQLHLRIVLKNQKVGLLPVIQVRFFSFCIQ